MKKYLAILLLALGVSAHAGITWAGWSVTLTVASTTATSFSLWITTTASANRLLVLKRFGAVYNHTTTGYITGATFNSNSFTYLTYTTTESGGNRYVDTEYWYLPYAPASTSGNLAITMANTSNAPTQRFMATEYDSAVSLSASAYSGNSSASTGSATLVPNHTGSGAFQNVVAYTGGQSIVLDSKITPVIQDTTNSFFDGYTTATAASQAFTYSGAGGGEANGQNVAEIVAWVASPTPTYTPTYTRTSTFTITPSATPTYTDTITPSDTPTFTRTFTSTNTPTYTSTNSPSPTFTTTTTPTKSSTYTQTATPSPLVTCTPSATKTPTVTKTISPTRTATAFLTRTCTKTTTVTKTITPTKTPVFCVPCIQEQP